MKKTAQKIHASTQEFIEIQDAVDNVVLLNFGNACSVIEVTSLNFALLSKEEQDAKIVSYASLLNSLSFPIQIYIRNKKIDISSYLTLLDQEAAKTTSNILSERIKAYRDFVKQLVEVNTVLDKKFYIIISYSSLEEGVSAVSLSRNKSHRQIFLEGAKNSLSSKIDSLSSQLTKMGLKVRVLEKEELIKLFYDAYNDEETEAGEIADDIGRPIIKTVK